MSNPPNRIGGARGPNGATLDDILAELVQIRNIAQGSRLDFRSFVGDVLPFGWRGFGFEWEEYRNRAAYLTGTTAPTAQNWGGSLPAYMAAVFGARNSWTARLGFEPPYAMVDAINSMDTQFNDVRQIIQGLTPLIAIANARNLLREVADGVNVLRTDASPPVIALTDAIDASTDELADLLDRLGACLCEDWNAGPPDPNEPPAFCLEADLWLPKRRVVAWENLGTVAGLTSWGAVFSPASLPSFVSTVDSGNPNNDWFGLTTTPGAFQWCISWRFPPEGVVPGTLSIKTDAVDFWGGTAGGTGVTSFTLPEGNHTFNGTALNSYGVVAGTLLPTPPPLGLWITWRS